MFLGYNNYYNLSDEERKIAFIGLMIFTIIVFVIYGILYYIKKKYKYKIEQSKSKIIKKIFDEI